MRDGLHEHWVRYRGFIVRVRCDCVGDLRPPAWAVQVDLRKGGDSPLLWHPDTGHRFATQAEAEQVGFTWGRQAVDRMLP